MGYGSADIENKPITFKTLVTTSSLIAGIISLSLTFGGFYFSLNTRVTVLEERTAGIKETMSDIKKSIDAMSVKERP